MTKKTVRSKNTAASRILVALAIGAFLLTPLIVTAYSNPAQFFRFVNSSTNSVTSPSARKVYTSIRKAGPTNTFVHSLKSVPQPLTDSTSIYSELFKHSVITDFLDSLLGHSPEETSLLTAPSITRLTPDHATAGSPDFTLTVTGTDFGVDPVTINFGSTPHTATIDDASHVSASISASEIATAGTVLVNVTNATSEISGDLGFTVTNPVPSISQLSPSSATAGTGPFSLSVTGSNFVTGAVIHFGATDYSASIDDATHVSATISAADIATAGNISVSVSNPGSSNSGALNFTVTNPVPSISQLTPSSRTAGTGPFLLSVTGSNFVTGAVIHFGATDYSASIDDATHVSATISAADIATAGNISVSVSNPGSSNSGALNFTVTNSVPSISQLSPSSATAGTGPFSLSVTGSNFVTGAVIHFGATDYSASIDDATHVSATISAADIATAGNISVSVSNPGSSNSGALNFTVTNPVPSISQLTPSSRTAGTGPFLLSATGSNFVTGAVIHFGATDYSASIDDATHVSATISGPDIAAAGSISVTISNPGSSNSSALIFTVNNPVPTLTTIVPATTSAGSAGFELTVNGTNFNSSSVVRLDGSDRVTSLLSSTQLTAQIMAADVALAGTRIITVFNPLPGGGTSGTANLVVTANNPVPTLTGIAPSSVTAGDANFTLTVNGTNFNGSSVVRLDGGDRVTALVGSTQLTAQITAADVAAAGIRSITVFNPAPGGGTSGAVTLNINNPSPTISTISPAARTAGDPAFALVVNGTGFNASSIVRFNGGDRLTALVSSTQLTAQITLADQAAAGTPAITVFNPTPGGGTSSSVNLTVNNPLPTITTLVPATTAVGNPAFTLTVNGSNFNTSSLVRLDGIDRVTAFVSATQLNAQITAADVATAGTRLITVFNPLPGGGTSTASPLTVGNNLPTVTTISPSSATAGDAAFILSITGTNFGAGTTVNFNAVGYVPAIVSSTNLTVQINASEIATAGLKPVTVTNPPPGGGTSTPALNFTVNNPVPTATSLSQVSATAGGPAFTLTVTGTRFVTETTVNFGATSHPGVLVDATHVSATIAATELLTPGVVAVTVANPLPGGGVSTPALSFTINNPIPTITTLSPPSVTVGNPGFVLTINGTNFNTTSVVRFNGVARVTSYVSATQITAQIVATDVAVVGSFPITVFNPLPGGGASNAVNLTVTNGPVPTITTISAPNVSAGGLDFVLTVTGTNFVAGSVVNFNGLPRTTIFVSGTQLTATIVGATDLVAAGAFPITVVNPPPGGGASNAVTMTVNPVITSLSPPSVRGGNIGFTLNVSGAGYMAGSVVRLNGVARSTTFIGSTHLTASISAADIAAVGTYPITVLTPAPSNLTSNAVNLTAIPGITNLSPMTAVVGSSAFTLTVSGTGFVIGSVVRWNGSDRITTFVSSTKVTASITAADISTVGPRPVTVFNPAPTNLSSNAVNFTVTNPTPATECPGGLDVTLSNPGLINSGPSRAQMWRTDDNIWWGAFSNNTNGIYFYKRVNPTTWTQGSLIDTNIVAGVFVAGAPDCLWTGTNLFMMIQESQALARLYKYTYNATTQTYTVVTGFPVDIALTGVGTTGSGKVYGTLAIEQDSTGRLWAAYTGGGLGGDGNMRVIWSTSADHRTWDTTGFLLASGLSTVKTEGAAIVRFGANKIGVAWSNLNLAENAFSFHNDADPVTTWNPKELIDSGLGPEGLGPVSGKQISMKAHPDGRIFLVSDDNDGLNNHVHLYIRPAGGVWGSKTLVVNDFAAMPSKALLLLDTDNNTVHVIYKDGAVTTNGLLGQTFITQSSMTNPAFNSPCLFIDTSDDTGVTSTSNPTSTKQTINSLTDLVAASSTGRNGNRILTNTVDITPNVLTIFSVAPDEVTAGESDFTMTITGKLFQPNSSVRLNNSTTGITTTFLNSGKLTALITGSRITTAGTFPIIVRNSSPAADSNVVNFVVTSTNPAPTVGLVTPNREPVGTPQFTMTLYGTGFRRTSAVRFNGVDKATQFVSDTQLMATIPASDMLVPGAYPITVFNQAPGGGTSVPNYVTTFYVVPSCAPPAGQSFSGITMFNTVKAQMWYNDGFWWGAFSDNVGGIYFYKQNGTTYTKGALLDSNFNGRPDVLWNGTNLFVLIYEFNTQARLYKFTYNTINDTYTLLSGFPVTLPLIGIGPGVTPAQTGSITIAEDSRGKLWAAYPGSFNGGDGNYRVIWSTSADHRTWDTTGFIFDTGADTQTQEVAPIVHFGGDRVGIVYSRQPTKEILFRYHLDGDPETSWSIKQIVNSGLGHAGGGGVADNHMSLRAAPDGRLFLAAKDSDFPFGYISLYTRSAAGVWSSPVLVDVDPHAAVTRPSLVLDLENSDAYVFYANAATGFMYVNKSSMNNPAFGPACPYVSQTGVSDSTSTRQNVRASMGVRAAGSTGGAISAIYINPITLVSGSGNAPVLSSISPSTVGVNSGNNALVTLTLNGSNFASGAFVIFNGWDRSTTFVNSTQLTVRLMASDLQTVGTYPITVMNPRGGTSAAVNLVVSAAITNLSPASATAGGAAFTLTVNGNGFVSGSVVRFNGSDRATTFVNTTQLTAQIPATDIATGGIVPIAVVNPGPFLSPPFDFTINKPVPAVTGLTPNSVIVGGPAFSLTVNGSNFTSSSTVKWNGAPRPTTFVNASQLTAALSAADIVAAGMFQVSVSTPPPGGGESNAIGLQVNALNPMPVLTSLSPGSATSGGAGFTITINGTGFVNGAVVRCDGSDRVTTLLSSSQLTAQMTAADIAAAGTRSIAVFNPAPGGGLSNALSLTVQPAPATLQFSSANYQISEGNISIEISVTRSGDTSTKVSADFVTDDSTVFQPCAVPTGGANQRCDFATAGGTLSFAPGETTKTFTLLNTDDAYVEGNETFTVSLRNPLNLTNNSPIAVTLGSPARATIMIVDNDLVAPTTNPIDNARYFINQHYLDFLNRVPDQGGLDFWTHEIENCGTDIACINRRRNGVSGAFFVELEFQRTGSVVYRIHKAAYGTNPSYEQFMPDRTQLVDGPQLPATTLDFANRFVLRPEFKAAYPDSMSASQFVNKLYDTALVMNNPTQRQQAIDALTNGTKSRAQVLLDLTEITEFKQREYNPSFVLMQYFGYLRRDPDPGGYEFWLDVINNREPNNYPSMICAFITSSEYQQRFSSVVTRSNRDCGQP